MSATELTALIFSIFSLAGIAYIAGVKLTGVEKDVEHIKDELRDLKDFLFRRGAVEAILTGRAEMNSPVKVSKNMKDLFWELKPDLKKMAQSNPKLSDSDLAWKIEKKWGDYIMKNICIPHRISNGECLLIAVAAARDED